MLKEETPSGFESSTSIDTPKLQGEPDRLSPPHTWLKVGAIAATSAVLGGLAAAWFYRKTLIRLQDAQHGTGDSELSSIEDDSPEDF